jgi:hypothetical protein
MRKKEKRKWGRVLKPVAVEALTAIRFKKYCRARGYIMASAATSALQKKMEGESNAEN